MTPYTLKQPGYIVDLSAHDTGKDLALATPRPGVIARLAVGLYPNVNENYRCVGTQKDMSAGPLFRKARDLGLLFGAYGYFLQNKVQDQAKAFIENSIESGLVKNGQWLPELPPFIDVEAEKQLRPKKLPKGYIPFIEGPAWAAQVKEWMDTVEDALGVKPAIYTARWPWKWVCTNKSEIYTAPAWTKDYEFWIKWYPFVDYVERNKLIADTELPTGVSRNQIILWQYDQYGRQRGFEYNDLNVLTDVGLLRYGNVVDPHPIPDPDPTIPPISAARKVKQIVFDDGTVQDVQ